ncbi:flowering time control protein FPA-like isoform X1 [Musa acuminata AAA Group]|uniref:flowering time control protein FPA-like isoform X1 n=1 Tax=Musa acuminata AAA Group TaxID=214697 RepID=UPI0031D3F70E
MPLNKSAGGSSDLRRPPPSKEPENDEAPSNTLWVGNLPVDITDPDVMAVFAKHGALDCTTMRGSRSYTFVYFRTVDEAKAAKEALKGSIIQGHAMRLEFARPPKAAKQIWVGGFNSSISKEQLEDEFLKFGKIEDYKFFRDRNSAVIEYYKLEDAIAAHKSMNGKRLAGEQIRVDFLRSQPPRRVCSLVDWSDRYDSRNGYLSNRTLEPVERSLPPDDLRNFHNSSSLGSKRDMPHGVRKDGHPSNILWVGYPPSVQIDEQMLHNAMILFGEIERIKCYPSRHYSFVEFRSVDEARRAKEGLQGRLFNDPRIQIFFSNSEFAPGKDNLPMVPSFRAHRPEMFSDEGPFGPLEVLGAGRSVTSSKFSGSLHSNVMPGTNIFTRSFGPQGFDLRHVEPEFHEFGALAPNSLDVDASKSMPPSWRRRSPSAPGILPSPSSVFQAARPMPDGWDGVDVRDPKRLRVDASPTNDGFLLARRVDGSSVGDHPFVFSHPDRGASSRSQLGSVLHSRPNVLFSDKDYCWRGVIAKGGTHVCYARCIPIGKGIDLSLSDVVNCSARTGLDMLAKHYDEAIGFDIVFFLPDSEDDFASYTDFLRYLGLKNRAGVAKLEDGTTLFLVPPSDFLTKVLGVKGPERLYGVVLKMPQQSTSTVVQQSQLAIPPLTSHHIDQQEAPNLQKFISRNEDQASRVDFNQSLHEEVARHAATEKFQLAHGDEQRLSQSAAVDQESNAPASQSKVSLTPDLIATLASLIPGNIQSSASGAVQLPSSSTVRSASSFTSTVPDGSVPFQNRRQDNQITLSVTSMEQYSMPPHLGQNFSHQAPSLPQFPPYINTSNGADPPTQPLLGMLQIQNPATNMPPAPPVSTSLLNSYAISQHGQFAATQSNQIYQLDTPLTSRDNYGSLPTTNVGDVFGSIVQQQSRLGSSSAHDLIGNIPQHQLAMPATNDKGNMEISNQGQQLQPVLAGSSQGTSQGDADKNQRYQSTLQFAANLLLQIQQQQQASAHTVQGSGNQQ